MTEVAPAIEEQLPEYQRKLMTNIFNQFINRQ
jgi:hypothetical protein